MPTVTYSINVIDTESPRRWMDIPSTLCPGPQDSGRGCWRAEVAADRAEELEAALEADRTVLDEVVS